MKAFRLGFYSFAVSFCPSFFSSCVLFFLCFVAVVPHSEHTDEAGTSVGRPENFPVKARVSTPPRHFLPVLAFVR
jgi:hypothetical protein